MSYELVSSDDPGNSPILPISSGPTKSTPNQRLRLSKLVPRGRPRGRTCLLLILLLIALSLLFSHTLGAWRRDFIYLIRPLWDKGDPPFQVIPHFASPVTAFGEQDIAGWCSLHGWRERQTDPGSGRNGPPMIVDAVLLSTELDMLEIRIREYLPYVSVFVVVEASRAFSGEDKPLYFEAQKERFDKLVAGSAAKIVYHQVTDLLPRQPTGSFDNEIKMRVATSEVITALSLPAGSLVIQSDVDEIISRETLQLLSSCQGYPETMHLNVANYRYDFSFPIPDDGYWRPHLFTTSTDAQQVGYHHSRASDVLLLDSGWHCSFCFPTLEDMRAKMRGYSHNDRLRNPKKLLDPERLRETVCKGEDPFDMYPEAFSFKDLVAQAGSLRKQLSFTHVPVALKEDSDKFRYLLDRGCDRPDQ